MNKLRSIVLYGLLLAALAVTPAYGKEISRDKRVEIEKLLEVTGALKIGQQFSASMVNQLAQVLRSSNPNLPKRAIEVLPEEVNAVMDSNMAGFKELLIQVYDRHYTLEDLKGLNQFYSTPLGRKVISTLPAVMQDSMAAGQKFGESLGPEIGRRLEARYKKEGIKL